MNSSRVAIITGGEGGLARAIRRCLEATGWKVHAPGRDELDVSRSGSVRDWFARLDRAELLVNNAGIIRDAPFFRLAEEDWDVVIDTNLKGAFLCSRAVFPVMKQAGGGHIVQIGSFSALRPPPGQTAYAAAKAGLIGLTRSLAAEWGGENVRVNCILPGFLETRMTAGLAPTVVESVLRDHQLGRFNTPDAVAGFLASLQGQQSVSGQIFQLDSRMARW